MTNIGFDVDLGTEKLTRGEVLHTDPSDSTVLVRLDDVQEVLRCDLLQTTSSAPLLPSRGDRVIVMWAPDAGQRGVVLGRIGVIAAEVKREVDAVAAPFAQPGEMPDEIVLEAKHSIILRVGEGSITIREDGKVLIKGKDLVSHAERMNRIKGGAVSIN
ncbi:MAG TPA: hypothetical protein VJW73_23355 [Gemmatimonadaceae bacterium]|nr:hypothetical protein [Gemmatimonadaceae bacterium]